MVYNKRNIRMLASFRQTRQIIIVSVYILIFTLLSVGVYYAFLKSPETCFDNKKNQDEQGIDCGGVCALACEEHITGEALEAVETAFVPSGNGRYDVLVKVHNPNDEIGASVFEYVLELKDSAGQIIATRTGTSFILPQENKYLLELNIDVTREPVGVSVRLDVSKWERFSGYREKPVINIYQRRYSEISSGSGFSEAYGLLSNESPYDFRSIVVKVILRDGNGGVLAFNMTEMRTVISHEERDFRLVWPTGFPGTVERVEMTVDADVYHSDNFIRQYLPGGKFQEFSSPSAY